MNGTVIVHPSTGEAYPVDLMAEADLCELVLMAKDLTGRLKEFRDAVDRELRHRLERHQRQQLVVDGYEIVGGTRRDAVWDAAELEGVLRELIDAGIVVAGEVVDVITRPPVVGRREADRLTKRLSGPAKEAVEACRHWRESAKAVDVTRLDRDPELQP